MSSVLVTATTVSSEPQVLVTLLTPPPTLQLGLGMSRYTLQAIPSKQDLDRSRIRIPSFGDRRLKQTHQHRKFQSRTK